MGRLREAIRRLNPAIPEEARDEALRKVLRVGTPALVQTNRAFHRMLRDGLQVEYPRPDGSIAGDHVRLVDFDDVRANDFFAVNQFTVIEGASPHGSAGPSQHNRRPDIVVFVNGLPLGLIELKNAADEDATIWSAYAQLQTYKAEIASLLHYNAALVVSDGLQARMGSVTANQEWFKVWRTIDGEGDAPKTALELEVLVRGVFEWQRFLDLLHHFIVFEEDPDSGALYKIIAGYHQFHAVNAAVEETVRASGMTQTGSVLREEAGTYWSGRQRGGKPGDRRAGVVWHTQGSGKSFSMLFFAARVVRHPAMQNPTLVVLTDRNDLDDQLFGQFQRCADILGQTPVQASGREHLRELLNRASGGVVFTTIHKFMPEKGEAMPELSGRQNIVVIADEAHRSQYGFGGKVNEKTGEMSYGFASNLRDALPNASFIGFTGTPIEKTDANTRAVFGDYISIYDIQRAVADKATVPIYYESRISKLSLNAAELPKLDAEFEEITEGEELTKKEKLKTKWAALEALVGDPKRVALVAADLVAHFEKRVEAMDGKAMIVTSSRVAGLRYFNIIKEKLKERGANYKVLYAFSDFVHPETNAAISEHAVNELQTGELIEDRFEGDDYRLMVVANKFQTGFDQPLLAGMFLDKPVLDRNAVQTVSRLNRCHHGKKDVVVVDFTNNAKQILKAFAKYRKGTPFEPEEPDKETCPKLHAEILTAGVFTQKDAADLLALLKSGTDAQVQFQVNALRTRFQAKLADWEDRKAFVYLLARFVKSFHFLTCFFTYSPAIQEFVTFAEWVGPQLIKAGTVSDLMKQIRATVVTKAAVQYQGVMTSGGPVKLQPGKGKGGAGPVPVKVSVQDVIAQIRAKFDITDEEALYIKQVTEEKIADPVIRTTVQAHRDDRIYLEGPYRGQVNGEIQTTYDARGRYDELADPKYTDTGGIFDIMAVTVIQTHLSLAA